MVAGKLPTHSQGLASSLQHGVVVVNSESCTVPGNFVAMADAIKMHPWQKNLKQKNCHYEGARVKA